jgi:hypothetical protein
MAQMFQVVIENSPASNQVDVGVSTPNKVIVQNFNELQSVQVGIGVTGTPPGAGESGYDTYSGSTPPVWIIKPEESTPLINLTSGQAVFVSSPGTMTDMPFKVQVYADLP